MADWRVMTEAEREAETARRQTMSGEELDAALADDLAAAHAWRDRERRMTGEELLAPIREQCDRATAWDFDDLAAFLANDRFEREHKAATFLREEIDYSRTEAGDDTWDFIRQCRDLARGLLCGLAGAGVGLAGLDRAIGLLHTLNRAERDPWAAVTMATIRNAICAPGARGWQPLGVAEDLFTTEDKVAFKARWG